MHSSDCCPLVPELSDQCQWIHWHPAISCFGLSTEEHVQLWSLHLSHEFDGGIADDGLSCWWGAPHLPFAYPVCCTSHQSVMGIAVPRDGGSPFRLNRPLGTRDSASGAFWPTLIMNCAG
jgi:hypothetical protein